MTAINIARSLRHKIVYVVTDGAYYDISDGIVAAFGTKVFSVPSWPGVVATRGSALATALVGSELTMHFQSFDEVVNGIEEAVEAAEEDWHDLFERCGMSTIEIFLAGWSHERDQPESYIMRTGSEKGAVTDDAATEDIELDVPTLKLVALPVMAVAPAVTNEQISIAGIERFDANDEPSVVIQGLRHAIEAQRHALYHADGASYHAVGGFAQLTTVTPDGIQQRILTRWNDEIGEPITPEPIDWAKWRADHLSLAPPPGLSRLQRMEKKARKGTLRAA
jgi:hypothetical protein